MTTFNTTFDWESTVPPSISTLDENDFMLLLQRQFPSFGSSPAAPVSTVPKKPVVQTANPQALNKFQTSTSISPLSTDSSPSPPSAHDDNTTPSGSDTHKRAMSADDQHHKRKASEDDFEDELDQPSAKNQHTDRSRKNSLTRRKSNGGEKGPDESRLLKRKEQNRAAQRAFRERKEKHVKDLEDKVAQLEAKTETQAAENDNLRDMLGRLQTENTLLKQSSFTFSVPPSSSAGPSNVTSRPTRSSSGSISMFSSNGADAGPSHLPSTSSSLSTSSTSKDSPSTLFGQYDNFSTLTASTPTSSAATPGSGVNNGNSTLSAADLETMALFGSTGPFTTISSNPMYTSYRDPIQSMNAFASFGGWDGDITMDSQMNPAGPTNAGGSTLDDLFGDQFAGLIPLPQDFLTGTGDGKASPASGSSGTAGVHNKTTGCPKTKEDVERMIAHGPKGTFGSLPMSHSNMESSGASAPNDENDYDAAFHEALGNITAAAKPCAGTSGDNFNIDELCLEMQRKAKCSMGRC